MNARESYYAAHSLLRIFRRSDEVKILLDWRIGMIAGCGDNIIFAPICEAAQRAWDVLSISGIVVSDRGALITVKAFS